MIDKRDWIHLKTTFLLCFLFPYLIFGAEMTTSESSKTGTIIIINGPSAAGKSSIQNELQRIFPQLYLKIGIDTFFDALIATPDLSKFEQTKEFAQYTNQGELIRRVRLTKDEHENPVVPLEIGPAGDKIIFGMHAALAAYADKGNNIIVDYILYKSDWLPDLLESLKANKVYFIGIKIPLSTLEEREKKRGTSPIGHARSHYDHVHQNMVYDLEIEVSEMSVEQIALKIKEFVEKNQNPLALKNMRYRLSKIPASVIPTKMYQ